MASPSPVLGKHTQTVLTTLVLSAEEISQLRAQNIVQSPIHAALSPTLFFVCNRILFVLFQAHQPSCAFPPLRCWAPPRTSSCCTLSVEACKLSHYRRNYAVSGYCTVSEHIQAVDKSTYKDVFRCCHSHVKTITPLKLFSLILCKRLCRQSKALAAKPQSK